MENLLSLESLRELGWGVEVFAVVTLTLLVRYIVMRGLKLMEKHLDRTENVWDDALFEAARAPLS
jgi:MscS family membrane protein